MFSFIFLLIALVLSVSTSPTEKSLDQSRPACKPFELKNLFKLIRKKPRSRVASVTQSKSCFHGIPKSKSSERIYSPCSRLSDSISDYQSIFESTELLKESQIADLDLVILQISKDKSRTGYDLTIEEQDSIKFLLTDTTSDDFGYTQGMHSIAHLILERNAWNMTGATLEYLFYMNELKIRNLYTSDAKEYDALYAVFVQQLHCFSSQVACMLLEGEEGQKGKAYFYNWALTLFPFVSLKNRLEILDLTLANGISVIASIGAWIAAHKLKEIYDPEEMFMQVVQIEWDQDDDIKLKERLKSF